MHLELGFARFLKSAFFRVMLVNCFIVFLSWGGRGERFQRHRFGESFDFLVGCGDSWNKIGGELVVANNVAGIASVSRTELPRGDA